MASSKNGAKSPPRKGKSTAKRKTIAKAASNAVKYSAPIVEPVIKRQPGLTLIGDSIMATARFTKSAGKIAGELTCVAFCISASMAANAWPRLSDMITGHADKTTVVSFDAQVVFVCLMAAAPLAALKAKNWSVKIAALFLGFVLFLINSLSAVEISAHNREEAASGPSRAQMRSKTLSDAIARDANELAAFGKVQPVSKDAVAAAKQAVEAAKIAQAQECGKVGDNDEKAGRTQLEGFPIRGTRRLERRHHDARRTL
jgi:hypothetical protein